MWRHRAACRGQWKVFDLAATRGRRHLARRIAAQRQADEFCATCQVRRDCLLDGLRTGDRVTYRGMPKTKWLALLRRYESKKEAA